MTPRAWAALSAVYVIWGSTYLGIKVAGDTIPAFSAVSARFILAGSLMAALVAWRQGKRALRVTRRELACAALIGLLLPGANGLLFVSERTVPTGVASLIIASVPLLVVLLRVAAGSGRRRSRSPACWSASSASLCSSIRRAGRRGGGSR